MNFRLTVIILVSIIGVYQLMLNLVRARSANNPTPDNLSDVYDAETYSRWKAYSAEYSKLAILSGLASCIVPILLLVTNAYSLFASLFSDGAFVQLFSVILLEVVVSTAVSSIFSYISTMKIEEKYGFNRSTKKTFIFDKIRGFIVEMLIALGLTSLLWGLYTALGDWLVPLFAIIVFVIMLAITFLYPILSRIGNTFTPLADGELKYSLFLGFLTDFLASGKCFRHG